MLTDTEISVLHEMLFALAKISAGENRICELDLARKGITPDKLRTYGYVLNENDGAVLRAVLGDVADRVRLHLSPEKPSIFIVPLPL
jgi:hypothetical protein